MVNREQIVAGVHDEWAAAGRLHDPPDDISGDDDLGFWEEVERRLAAEPDGWGKTEPEVG